MYLRSIFVICSLMVAPVVASSSVQAGTSTTSALAPHEYSKTCGYFRHRAEALRQQMPQSPFVQLGDSCAAALERLKVADVYFRLDGRAADQLFLKHLTRLKRTIIKMNVARFTEGSHQKRVQSVQTVTETGQYLVARRLGIFDAHAAWQVAVEEERIAGASELFEETGDVGR